MHNQNDTYNKLVRSPFDVVHNDLWLTRANSPTSDFHKIRKTILKKHHWTIGDYYKAFLSQYNK